MGSEVHGFSFLGKLDWDSVDDVLLRSILNSNETKSKSNILAFNHPLRTGTLVHDINLFEHIVNFFVDACFFALPLAHISSAAGKPC